ncbi:hypothetical protein [Undibacterium sp.]|uniref:hypothetical protein n=1 Tax=Undibacterium sp. TaxID=1914977 RepID=UPI002730A4F1|nr:hypothetical protein [Undibacterium sp.]MDP1978692.1 hypothetical protein [Undibacterium sp.]
MKFVIEDARGSKKFILFYRDSDYSFDIEPGIKGGGASIMVNDLQLEMTDQGEIIYVWGLCPMGHYKKIEVFPKHLQNKAIFAVLESTPQLGVSYRLNPRERWPTFINLNEGWICIGNPELSGRLLIEFAPKCVASMKGEEIVAIWLKPVNLPIL